MKLIAQTSMIEAITHLLRSNPDIVDHVLNISKKISFENVQRQNNAESTFSHIYKNNLWHSDESVSGPGSELFYTINLREKLPNLFETFKIDSILDAPCGDFNWMKEVIGKCDLKYTGGDIVLDLVQRNKQLYAKNNIEFIHLDITKDPLPYADLLICRDCLFHLSFESINRFLFNFIKSDINYILTTTHYNELKFENSDIMDGGFRLIDLLSKPFNLTPEVLFEIDDWTPGHPKRRLCLWSKDQIKNALETRI